MLFRYIVVLISLNALGQIPGAGVTDINGNYYSTVIIGSQEWMTSNLKTSKYVNGNNINISGFSDGVYFYNNDFQLSEKYGCQYTWYAVNTNMLCPIGWRVPSNSDWLTLSSYLGGNLVAGGKMKSTSTNWISPNVSATNSSGFKAEPGGAPTFGSYGEIGKFAYFWCSDNVSGNTGWSYYLYNGTGELLDETVGMGDFLSVRCMKQAPLEINEIQLNKTIVKIIDLTGREIQPAKNTIMIYIYDDGTSERVFEMDK
jgi:uncharacterized protein (TIGR02145 family)